jgi:hypothetical protein
MAEKRNAYKLLMGKPEGKRENICLRKEENDRPDLSSVERVRESHGEMHLGKLVLFG